MRPMGHRPSDRRASRRWLSLAALAAAVMMIAGACGDDGDDEVATTTTAGGSPTTAGSGGTTATTQATGLLAELQASGSITIGIANEAPFGFVGEDGEATGAAPDVARAVLAELGINEVNAEVVEFGQLIGGLQAGQFDLIAAGMYITPERAQQILFTDPDYCITESLAVEEGNPLGIVDYQSVVENPDITLAVASGTVEVGYAEDAGVPDSQLEVFADIDGMYAALEAGEVDAVTGTSATVATQVAARSGIEAVEPFFPRDAEGNETLPCGGYGFRIDNEPFRDAFNDVLNDLKADGTTVELITAYEGFAQEDVELANDLTVDDFL